MRKGIWGIVVLLLIQQAKAEVLSPEVLKSTLGPAAQEVEIFLQNLGITVRNNPSLLPQVGAGGALTARTVTLLVRVPGIGQIVAISAAAGVTGLYAGIKTRQAWDRWRNSEKAKRYQVWFKGHEVSQVVSECNQGLRPCFGLMPDGSFKPYIPGMVATRNLSEDDNRTSHQLDDHRNNGDISSNTTLLDWKVGKELPRARNESLTLDETIHHRVDGDLLTYNQEDIAELVNKGSDPEYAKVIRADVIASLQTVRLFHSDGLVPAGSKAIVVALHGCGTTNSTALTMRRFIRLMGGKEKTPGQYGGLRREVRDNPNYVPLGIQALGLPGAPGGPQVQGYPDVDAFADHYGTYFRALKREHPGLPLIIYARSASPAMVSRIVNKYPGVIDGLIFVSPTKPSDPDLLDKAVARLRANSVKEGFRINEVGLKWARTMLDQVSWENEDFAGIPVLILTGGLDYEMTNIEREFYKELARRHSNISYLEAPSASHDILFGFDGIRINAEDRTKVLNQMQKLIYETVTHYRH